MRSQLKTGFLNDPIGISITKLINGDETDTIPSLEGTQFTIKYYDGYYTESSLPSVATRSWVIETKKVGNLYIALLQEEYKVSGDDLYKLGDTFVLPLGTVTIQETSPAPGYTLNGYLTDFNGNTVSTDSELYITQITQEGEVTFLKGGNEYTGYNTPVNGSVKIVKYDTDGRTPLAGVGFELKDLEGNVAATGTTDKEDIERPVIRAGPCSNIVWSMLYIVKN